MPLTPELLERLERCWVDQQVPWLESLRPGVSGDQLDEILAPFGRAIPTEFRLWWGWHNGAREPLWVADALEIVSADAAARGFQMMRRIAQDAPDPDSFWPSTWLPVFGTGGSPTYAVDCAGDQPRESGLIYYQDSHPNPQTGFVAAASLGDVVHQLCEAYDAGLQRWDHAREHVRNRWVAAQPRRRRPFGF